MLRHDGVLTDVARPPLAGHARADLLFVDELLAGTCDRLERRGAADLLEGGSDLLLLPVDVGGLKDVDQLTLRLLVAPELGDGGGGVAADLLGRVLQEADHPGLHRRLHLGIAGRREDHAHGPDQGDLLVALLRAELVELRDLDGPELGGRQLAQLSVKVVVGFHGLGSRAGGRQSQGRRRWAGHGGRSAQRRSPCRTLGFFLTKITKRGRAFGDPGSWHENPSPPPSDQSTSCL